MEIAQWLSLKLQVMVMGKGDVGRIIKTYLTLNFAVGLIDAVDKKKNRCI